MPERGWVATCRVCRWSALVFTREVAEAARSAHERMSKHPGVAVHSTAEIGQDEGRSEDGYALGQQGLKQAPERR